MRHFFFSCTMTSYRKACWMSTRSWQECSDFCEPRSECHHQAFARDELMLSTGKSLARLMSNNHIRTVRATTQLHV